MKILVLPSWYPPKGGRFFKELNEAISEQGVEIDVLVNEIISIKEFNINKLIKKNIYTNENGLNVYRSYFYNIPKLDFFSNRLWIKNTFRRYKEYVKQNGQPDIIHVHSSIWAGVTASIINKIFSTPYIISEHRSRFIFNSPKARKMLDNRYIPLVKKALKNASVITTVSPALNPKLIEIEPTVKDKIISIPNTVDVEDFLFTQIKEPTNKFIWFSLGNLTQVKGMDILISAFAEVVRKYGNNVELRIGGDGDEYSKLKKLCKSLNLEKKIIFLKKLDRRTVIKEMRNTHAFVLPSRFEAFGVVYIEALSCGVPVVGTDAGGQSSIINSENGYLVETENTRKLSEAMLDLMKNYNKFNKKEIRKSVIEKYEKNTVAKKYIELYADLRPV